MSVIKQAIRTVSRAGKKTHKVGKKALKLSQLNVMLKIERDKKDQLYLELGKYVCGRSGLQLTQSRKVEEAKQQVKMHEEKIKRLVREINHLRQIHED